MTDFAFGLVIFDLDGTLIDAFADIALAANHVRERNDLPFLSIAEVKQHVGHGARYLVEGVLGTTETAVIDENLAALVEFYKGMKDSQAEVYDGVLETLEQLQAQGVCTAVASNKPHPVALQVVAQLGLAPFLDFVRGETPDVRRKPAPDALLRVMADAGVGAEDTLMVGDTEMDIAAARAAGVRVAAVTYGQHGTARLSAATPDYLLSKMPELLAITR